MRLKDKENTLKNTIALREKKKSSTISFRIDENYLVSLREESQEKKVSLNTLANQIFGDYVEWQRYVERFGIIAMSKDAFRYILDSLDDTKIIELATTIGQIAPKEFIIFKWKNLNSENLLKFIKMYFVHCGYGRYDYVKDVDNKNAFSIHHELGHKGTLFLKSYMETLVKSIIDKECKSIITKNSLVVRFTD